MEIEHALRRQEIECVNEYRKQQEKERRDSLAHKLYVVHKEHKDVEEKLKQMQNIMDEEDNRLKALDHIDVQNYKNKINEDRRKSLMNRGIKKVN